MRFPAGKSATNIHQSVGKYSVLNIYAHFMGIEL